jgi:hypothetical protein
MNRNLVVLLIVFALFNAGCGMCVYTVRNISNEISTCKNDLSDDIHYHRLAKSAWRTYQEANSTHQCSDDFAAGFQDGYVGCLEAGGKSIPPTFPPRDYTRRHWDPPSVEDWHAGYSSGVLMAQMSTGPETKHPQPHIRQSQPLEDAKQHPSTSPGLDKPSPPRQGTPYARYSL